MIRKEKWIWVAAFVVASVMACAFASCVAQAGGPVEPPSRIRVPYEAIRATMPEAPLDQFFKACQPWELLVRQINDANKFTYEGIRGEQVKESGRLWVNSTGSSTESTWVALSKTYDSSSYVILVAQHRGAESTPDLDTSVVVDHRSGIISHNKYSDGFWIKAYGSDEFWAHWALLVP